MKKYTKRQNSKKKNLIFKKTRIDTMRLSSDSDSVPQTDLKSSVIFINHCTSFLKPKVPKFEKKCSQCNQLNFIYKDNFP